MTSTEQWADLLEPGLRTNFNLQTEFYDCNSTNSWEEIVVGISTPAFGTTSPVCEYCGQDETSKYGACVGCGFTQED